MPGPIAISKDLIVNFREFLRIARTPPSTIVHPKDHVSLNLAGLTVSSVLFIVARAFSVLGVPGAGASIADSLLLNVAITVGAALSMFVLYWFILLLSRDNAAAEVRADQWATFFLFIWLHCLLFYIIDATAATIFRFESMLSYIAMLPVGAQFIASLVYTAMAFGLLAFKTNRDIGWTGASDRYWAPLIGILLSASLLLYVVVTPRAG